MVIDKDNIKTVLENEIKKYKAEALLKKIFRVQSVIYSKDGPGAMINHTIHILIKGEVKPITATITPWDLNDLAYYTIIYSNDYRGKDVITDDNVAFLVLLVQEYNASQMKLDVKDTELYLYGIMGEQFKYQTFYTQEHICRENYILFECSKKLDLDIDFENIFDDKIGLGWRKIIAFLLLGILSNTGEIKLSYRNELTGEVIDITDLILSYTFDYKQVRKTKLGRQIFYVKPFIKTQMGNNIQISPYLTRFICEHCNLWQLRDYYLDKPNVNMPSIFGECFEIYLRELFEELIPNSYEHIVEGESQRADWKIKIGKYDILIEQKSSLLAMDIKQQNSNIENLKDYLKENVIEALCQLENTEKSFEDKRFIKIILLYEEFLEPEILDKVFEMEECEIDNDNYYWLMNIREFEILIDTYVRNEESFNIIMKEKIKREIEHSKHGKSIRKLFEEKNIWEDKYLDSDKFDKYKYESIAKDYLKWSEDEK